MDFQRFFNNCAPNRTLDMGNPQDCQYYIDFASVRGSNIIQQLERTITRLASNQPTCQLFSGHVGCGKSTELLRLKAELEQQNFYVVYFDCKHDLDLSDVDVTDILLAIARQVSESLEQSHIHLQPKGFKKLLQDAVGFLQTPIELSGEATVLGGKVSASTEGSLEFSLPVGIGKITAKAKDSPDLRSRLRQYLEPRTNNMLKAINEELLQPATEMLKQQGKQGLVVIVDSLDRVGARLTASGRLQTEYLFIDRGEQLRGLRCHLVYTVPLVLLFSNDSELLKNHLGGGIAPKILPMVPTQFRDGQTYEEGMQRLRQMVLVRAFPELTDEERLQSITKVFDSSETLDRLCRISGGHVRNLLGLLYGCLRLEDPPLSRNCLESVIQEYRDSVLIRIDDEEWDLILQVVQDQNLKGEKECQILLPSLFFFEYRDRDGCWYGINPVLAETQRFKFWQNQKSNDLM